MAEKKIDEQPFYVLSAICNDSQTYDTKCEKRRADIKELTTVLNANNILGKGYEIKAKEVINPQGYWKKHNDERQKLL